MRLAAGCQFRGADDTLPIVVANLVSLGFDLIYLVDHRNDGLPLPLLQRLTDGRCALRVIRKSTETYAQSGVHSLLLRMAQTEGAHAYLHVDADELLAPVPSTRPSADGQAASDAEFLREVVHRWLSSSASIGLLIPHQNVLQRRDVGRWGVTTITVPNRIAIGPADGIDAADAGYFATAPKVRAMVRLAPGTRRPRWVRWGSHRVYGRVTAGGSLASEVSPDLVMLHLAYPSRAALEQRLRLRRSAEARPTENRGSTTVRWEDVSLPADGDDPHPGPPVRTVPTTSFSELRDRLEATGLLAILADEALAAQSVTPAPSESDLIFSAAADLLTATIVPRTDTDADTADGALSDRDSHSDETADE